VCGGVSVICAQFRRNACTCVNKCTLSRSMVHTSSHCRCSYLRMQRKHTTVMTPPDCITYSTASARQYGTGSCFQVFSKTWLYVDEFMRGAYLPQSAGVWSFPSERESARLPLPQCPHSSRRRRENNAHYIALAIPLPYPGPSHTGRGDGCESLSQVTVSL
jgi:hypothetical protein